MMTPVADLAATPSSIAWSELGATSPVKDQGQCGSCFWAKGPAESSAKEGSHAQEKFGTWLRGGVGTDTLRFVSLCSV